MDTITILYSPQPDEQADSSAAYQYAKRASDLLSQPETTIVNITRLSLDNLKSPRGFTLIILSCSADGSVDRTVRKLIRNMKNDTKKQEAEENGCDQVERHATSKLDGSIAIALLGHARCDNSANQMKDTIFNHGRKFHKCIEVHQSSSKLNTREILEVQVELEGPDKPGGFDEWISTNSKY